LSAALSPGHDPQLAQATTDTIAITAAITTIFLSMISSCLFGLHTTLLNIDANPW
jgi:translation initiation factor 2B subunit (eIF-2B alpha/beta/delta family)